MIEMAPNLIVSFSEDNIFPLKHLKLSLKHNLYNFLYVLKSLHGMLCVLSLASPDQEFTPGDGRGLTGSSIKWKNNKGV